MEKSLESLRRHPWLIPMVKSKLFHEKCEEHANKKRCYFCCDCMTPPFCSLCQKSSQNHQGHTLIQTYRSSYQSGVQIQTMSKYFDTSEISIYVINSHKIIYINQRRDKEHASRANAACKCQVCAWELDPASSAKFCSIECKLRSLLGSKLDELIEKQEPARTETEVVVPKPVRRHRRKGIPQRGPMFETC
ncbi:PREDICTED: uncharacterized protein At3g50808 [Tarenaya hassleriana]|uniref:uncharacterized protein At3g50808 n=1 Tax=Tarenaya hassleriana TaxID=28532 RepID=UPI00053C0B8D|nr:PREDICTED: uncharacterized protein At3g50808 [Tarenaya hassleriana]